MCAGSVPRADPAENSGSPVTGAFFSGASFSGTSFSGTFVSDADFFRHQPAMSSPPESAFNTGDVHRS
ncbi:pentapeptide repeat-containing protein [Streptomyces sp. NPDC059166]|uniref:pentapeptide repeat-containing protein n=1 Tax=Streptomyces sp. NPDC059166 TaxID=3346752 RepID=UPI0036BB7A12